MRRCSSWLFLVMLLLVCAAPTAGALAAPLSQSSETIQHDNFPLDESLLLYIDGGSNLRLENINTGAMVQLTSSGNVSAFTVSPTRQTLLYNDASGRGHLISLEFLSDDRLILSSLAAPLPAPVEGVDWSPDGTKLAYRGHDSQLVATTIGGEPIPFPADVMAFGGWSHDSRWLAYCRSNSELGVIEQAGAPQFIASGLDCPPSLATIMSWSPAAPQLAYALGDSSEGFMTPHVFDFATGTHYPLAAPGELLGWSPDGHLLALGHGRVGAHFEVSSVTVTDPTGRRTIALPGLSASSPGVTGWVSHYWEGAIFGHTFVPSDLGFTENMGDAVFGIAEDRSTLLWGQFVGSGSASVMSVYCVDPRFADHSIYDSDYPVLPEPNSPLFGQVQPFPGIRGVLSPDGRTALISAYVINQGERGWERVLLSCESGRPLMREETGEQGFAHSERYSADSRNLFLVLDVNGREVPQLFSLNDAGVDLRRTFVDNETAFEWLITSDAAPTVGTSSEAVLVAPAEATTVASEMTPAGAIDASNASNAAGEDGAAGSPAASRGRGDGTGVMLIAGIVFVLALAVYVEQRRR